MNVKRIKHKGMYLATMLLVGLMVAVFTGMWSQSGDDGLLAAAPAAKKTHAAHAQLVTEFEVALKNLSAVEKAVGNGKKSDALKLLARVRELLTGIRDRAKSAGTKPAEPGPVVKGWTEDLDKALK